MEQWPVAALGAIPLPGDLGFHANGVFGTLVDAGGAAIAGDGIDTASVIHPPFLVRRRRNDCIEAANLLAHAAALAAFGVDHGHCAAGEVVRLAAFWAQYQFQVGGVHIGIRQNGAQGSRAFTCQVGKRSRQAGLAGAAFAAQNDDLFHARHISQTVSF
jgi:hypothetical protein